MFKVLIVDDREVFRRQLKRMPYWKENTNKFKIFYEAQNGLEALELLSAHSIDVVITDIRMPFIDGIELLKEIHTKNLCKCVILLSEFADFKYAKGGILNGAFDYVLKPVDNDMIQNTFDRAYGFLTTTKETGFIYKKESEAISQYLLSGDTEKVHKYTVYLSDKITREEDLNHQAIVIEECMKIIKMCILNKYALLEQYINFDQLNDFKSETSLIEKVTNYQNVLKEFLPMTNQKMIKKICQNLLQEPCSIKSIRSLAEEYYVNPKYLGRMFKIEVGKSYSEYITFLNISKAKVLLSQSGIKIYEVSEKVGYQDVEYFSRVFKKEVGESPKAYWERITHG